MIDKKFPNKTVHVIALIIFASVNLVAQQYQNVTVYTPHNTAVSAYSLLSGDYTANQKNDAKNYWLSIYGSKIEYKAEATHTYNCHAYAWHMSEGGSAVWINTPEDDKYWNDYSYVEVSSPRQRENKQEVCSI